MSNADERIRENMKSYNHLYENCISEENRRISLNLAKHSKRMRRIIKNRHLSDDALVALSYDWINNYENAEHVPVYIYDGITRKERVIIVPTMEELIVQHNVVNALKPMFCKGMYEHSYASLPGRGAHKGKQVIEKWIRTDARNCKYVLKMDIRHFFDTVPHDKLKAKLRKTIHDEKMLDLLFRIIDVTDVGIPLGFYTSQWLSNWYLQGLDHYIKERLGAVHYMRYMDDMVIFGSNKKVLHRTRQAISDYLENELGLSLKDNWQVFRFSYGNDKGRDLDFMGFRFFRNRTILRKTIMYKATRKARKLSRKEKRSLLLSLTVGAVYILAVLCLALGPWGIVRSITGGLKNSPLSEGVSYLLSLGLGIMAIIYGYSIDLYRTDRDIIKGMSYSFVRFSGYCVTLFFVIQLFTSLHYTGLDSFFGLSSEGFTILYTLCSILPLFVGGNKLK